MNHIGICQEGQTPVATRQKQLFQENRLLSLLEVSIWQSCPLHLFQWLSNSQSSICKVNPVLTPGAAADQDETAESGDSGL